jgi:pyruvate/2-oxoglutarate/acetoin dehydrogenase E1 component
MLKMKDSINIALQEFIFEHNTKLFGEDILDFPIPEGNLYGGAFKVTEGLSTKFPQAVQNFPISESAMIGFGTGTALSGTNTIIEIMFSDFLAQCFDQIIHQVSKLQSIYGSSIELPLLIRTASGPGKGYGPTHSHTLESQLVGLPNIEVISANPFIPYIEILNAWHQARKCFIVFEPKNLYLYSGSEFNSKMFEVCLPSSIFDPVFVKPKHGQADLTIIVYGSAIWRVINQLDFMLYEHEISIEVIIPTVISNWNQASFHHSLQRNGGKLLVISDNLNSNGFQERVIVDSFSKGVLKKIDSLNYLDWIPNGRLEDEHLLNEKSLTEAVLRLLKE